MPEHRYVITFMCLLLAILKIKDFVCENNINNCIIIYGVSCFGQRNHPTQDSIYIFGNLI